GRAGGGYRLAAQDRTGNSRRPMRDGRVMRRRMASFLLAGQGKRTGGNQHRKRQQGGQRQSGGFGFRAAGHVPWSTRAGPAKFRPTKARVQPSGFFAQPK